MVRLTRYSERTLADEGGVMRRRCNCRTVDVAVRLAAEHRIRADAGMGIGPVRPFGCDRSIVADSAAQLNSSLGTRSGGGGRTLVAPTKWAGLGGTREEPGPGS